MQERASVIRHCFEVAPCSLFQYPSEPEHSHLPSKSARNGVPSYWHVVLTIPGTRAVLVQLIVGRGSVGGAKTIGGGA